MTQPRVVIIGGGFGGLAAARALAQAPVEITLLDRRNHHLFQPLLYQVATGGLSAAEIAMPIRKILRSQPNVTVLLGDAVRIDVERRAVVLADGELSYDFLIVATGASHAYFGHDDWEPYAPGLKSIEDAFEIRRRVFFAFEAAERATDPEERRAWLSFAVVGGGATGVELAGALAEIARRTLAGDFRRIDTKSAEITLIEGIDRVLTAFSPKLSQHAERDLEALGVRVRKNQRVTGIDAEGVLLGEERLRAKTVLWAAGVQGSSLGRSLGAPLAKNGQVEVEPDLTIPRRPEVYVIGDLASIVTDGQRVPGVAQGAMQMGALAAHNIERTMAGQPRQRFRYVDRGIMATIGRSAAVARVGKLEFSGFLAWMAWLFIHLMALVGFRNRLFTLLSWSWAYFTYQRAGRLILETRGERHGPK
ncbi:MAG: NAD(P)/FAD-dependent oxidoreductase [Myxococcota bacterium]